MFSRRLEKGCIGNEWVKAEIIWLLKCVISECSLRFNDGVGDTWCSKYPGFESLQNFSTTRSKSVNTVTHILEPYFKTSLELILQKSRIIWYSFGESLNEVTQTCEMDFFVRSWQFLLEDNWSRSLLCVLKSWKPKKETQ